MGHSEIFGSVTGITQRRTSLRKSINASTADIEIIPSKVTAMGLLFSKIIQLNDPIVRIHIPTLMYLEVAECQGKMRSRNQ